MVYMNDSDTSSNLPMFIEVGHSIFRIDDVVFIRFSPDARSDTCKVDIFTDFSVSLNQPNLSLLLETKKEIHHLFSALFYLHQRFVRDTFGIEEYGEDKPEQADELIGEFAKDRGEKMRGRDIEEEDDEKEDEEDDDDTDDDMNEYEDDDMEDGDEDEDEDDFEEDDLKTLDFVPIGNFGFVRLSHIRGLIQIKTASNNKNVSNKKYELLVSLKSDAPHVHISMNTKEAKSLSEFLSYFCLSADDETDQSEDDHESSK